MTIERKLWGGVMHMGKQSFPLVHAFQANIWTKGNLRDPPFTRNPLPTKPFLSYYPRGILQAWTMGYKDNTWFFAGFLMAFCIHLGFPCVSQGHLLKAWKRHIKVLGPWCSSCCISSDRDPCCMSFDLTEILFFFSFFLGFWAFMVLLSFMNWAFFC